MNNINKRPGALIGRWGEDLACSFLKQRGHIVVRRNYRKKLGEIDIITHLNDKTYFIEVKSVSCEMKYFQKENNHVYKPEFNMSMYKMDKLRRVITLYILENKVLKWQFDVIGVYIDINEQKAFVTLIENIII